MCLAIYIHYFSKFRSSQWSYEVGITVCILYTKKLRHREVSHWSKLTPTGSVGPNLKPASVLKANALDYWTKSKHQDLWSNHLVQAGRVSGTMCSGETELLSQRIFSFFFSSTLAETVILCLTYWNPIFHSYTCVSGLTKRGPVYPGITLEAIILPIKALLLLSCPETWVETIDSSDRSIMLLLTERWKGLASQKKHLFS